jgi:hypothetical protein
MPYSVTWPRLGERRIRDASPVERAGQRHRPLAAITLLVQSTQREQ